MDLPTKTIRDGQGIDTFERAIAYSAFLLRKGYFSQDSDNSLKDFFKIVVNSRTVNDEIRGLLQIEANFLVDVNVLGEGSDLLANLIESVAGAQSYTGETLSASTYPIVPIVNEPLEVTTLESYCLWSCQYLLAQDLGNQYSNITINTSYRGSVGNTKITAVINLEYDYLTYLQTNNVLAAIGELNAISVIVPGTVNNTDDLAEGSTNLYYTDARARNSISVTGTGGTYDNTTGVFTLTGGTDLSTANTDELAEGSTNLYYTDTRARNSISVIGSGSYDNATGVITINTSAIDNISLTGTAGNVDTYTIWGDSGQTINLGTFTVTNGTDVDNISLTGTAGNVDTYTVWGDSGQTINLGTFTVTNGLNGTNGTNGSDGQSIDNVSLTSTVSNVDTYTVWGDSGQTINLGTFTVTNGLNGTVTATSALVLNEQTSSPSLQSGSVLVFAKDDKKLYTLDDTGNEQLIGSGSGGGGASVNDIWLYGGL